MSNKDMENIEKKELSKFSIGLIIVIVTLFIGGAAYLFLGKDAETNEAVEIDLKGKTVPLSKDEIEHLSILSTQLIKEAGTFGFIEEEMTPDSIGLISKLRREQDPLFFTDYFISRGDKMEQLKENGWIALDGKANLKTDNWDDKSTNEILSYSSTTIKDIKADVPNKAIDNNGLILVKIPVSYTSMVRIGENLQTEAPPPGEDPIIGIRTRVNTTIDNKIILIFGKFDGEWKLYDFNSQEPPYGLVFWTNPNYEKMLSELKGTWNEGETIESTESGASNSGWIKDEDNKNDDQAKNTEPEIIYNDDGTWYQDQDSPENLEKARRGEHS